MKISNISPHYRWVPSTFIIRHLSSTNLLKSASKSLKGTQLDLSIRNNHIIVVRDQYFILVQHQILRNRPSYSFLSEVTHNHRLLVFKTPSIGKYIRVICIQELKIPIDEQVLVLFAQPKDRCPVLKDAVFDTDLRFGIYIYVAPVFLLPGFGCREARVLGVVPLRLPVSNKLWTEMVVTLTCIGVLALSRDFFWISCFVISWSSVSFGYLVVILIVLTKPSISSSFWLTLATRWLSQYPCILRFLFLLGY